MKRNRSHSSYSKLSEITGLKHKKNTMKKHGVDIQQLFEEVPQGKAMSAARKKSSASTLKLKLSSVPATSSTTSKMLLPTGHHNSSSSSSKSQRIVQTSHAREVITPSTAIMRFSDKLSPYELEEIKAYHKIYCVGQFAKKIGFTKINSSKDNYEFDDSDHFYKVVPHDHIGYRYEISERPSLGQGTFGQVIKVYDFKERQYVALKIVRNEKDYLKQSREELRILHVLKKHDVDGSYNIVTMKEFFMFRNHMVMSFELLGMNLYQVLKLNMYHGMQLPKIKIIAKAILKSLELLFKLRIIHCDVKPENILLRRNGDYNSVKLVDFGSSCYEQSQIYHYIQSRYYRAPEVILGFRYGPAIDMWSLGCVLSELAKGTPIFVGEDEFDQLAAIEEILGSVPSSMVSRSKVRPPLRKGRGAPGSKSLKSVLTVDEGFKDLVKKMLELNPEIRPTPLEIQNHYWLGVSKADTDYTQRTDRQNSGPNKIMGKEVMPQHRQKGKPRMKNSRKSTAVSGRRHFWRVTVAALRSTESKKK